MKLHCKCGQQLTRSMFPSKEWTEVYVERDDEGFIVWGNFEKLKGSFQIIYHEWYEQDMFLTNRDSVLDGIIPPYKNGRGCCDLDMCPIHCPNCNEDVGRANLDCHQDKSVDFFEKKVDRRYK